MSHRIERVGEVIDLDESDSARSASTTLLENEAVKLILLVVPRGREIPPHTAPGALIVQCLVGRIELTALGKTLDLHSDQLLFLPAGERHSLKAIDDAVLLLTIVRERIPALDVVDEAGEESFPASDPPARTPLTRP